MPAASEAPSFSRATVSMISASRFGFRFEGLFHQHMIVKGLNRDRAWYSAIDSEWPIVGKAIEAWLDPSNFDNEGRQKVTLEDMRRRQSG